MKKFLISTTLIIMATTSAHAASSTAVGIVQPGFPAYAQPYPTYYTNDRHHNYNYGYWNGHESRAGERRVMAERDYDRRWDRDDQRTYGRNHTYGYNKRGESY